MADIWDELGEKVQYIRDLYAARNIQLKPNGGLAKALNEAEQLAQGIRLATTPDERLMRTSVESFHVIWALHASIKGCIDAGLNIDDQLNQITSGTTDYGTRAPAGQTKPIYFKDYECELFVASMLANAGLPVEFLPNSDPRGEMRVDEVFIEVKHPNSKKQLRSLLAKFNGYLEAENRPGIFFVGLEDVADLGDKLRFDAPADFLKWQEKKRDEMDSLGTELVIPLAARLSHVAALGQSSTKLEVVAGQTTLRRNGNALLFDGKDFGPANNAMVLRIANVFTPGFGPKLYSQMNQGQGSALTNADAKAAPAGCLFFFRNFFAEIRNWLRPKNS